VDEAHPSSWSLERNERAPRRRPLTTWLPAGAAAEQVRPALQSYLCSTARCWLHRLRRSAHRRRLRKGRSSLSAGAEGRRWYGHSMDRLSHHRRRRHRRRHRPADAVVVGTIGICRYASPVRCCRGCSSHAGAQLPGQQGLPGIPQSRMLDAAVSPLQPCRRRCSSGSRQPAGKARQLRTGDAAVGRIGPLRHSMVQPCRWYHSRRYFPRDRIPAPTRRPCRAHRQLELGHITRTAMIAPLWRYWCGHQAASISQTKPAQQAWPAAPQCRWRVLGCVV